MRYKLRAECASDVAEFMGIVNPAITDFDIKKWDGFPDVDFEFESDLSLEEIITIMKKIVDSHVMVQTVKPINEYTGERDYDL